MITASDLRIGNCIRDIWSSDTACFRVEQLLANSCTYGLHLKAKYCNLIPIPLTEEILLKCNCKKRPEGFIGFKIFAGTYLEINIPKKRTIIFLEDGSKCIELKHNQYLHEFQNLIYALTKTELIINL